ncbi:MAG: STAS domain-containing protein [candidate division KSB1 bacterium]|nr:STAS domain-containing protein [candidate division KSB1 bacterium]MDZ7300806.1 STAS domain-containing protein [candidate division KSB1 bacterium]MDZ7309923.1 STAS domain-containing protein [candidate division KSB1 bacterium]
MPNYLTLSVRQEGEVTIVEVLVRRIYLKVVEEFREEINDILATTHGPVLLDLGKVSVMNSAGLGVIIAAHDYMQKQQRQFLVANLQPLMQEIFNRMQLGTLITTVASVTEGLQKLQEAPQESPVSLT